MQLKDILNAKGGKVLSVRENQTLKEALHILIANKIGALLVMDERDQITGILSERDIMRECHKENTGWALQLVVNAMTKKLIIGTPEDHVDYIMGIMTQNRVRHIPVIEKDQLRGMISIGDVVKAQLKDTQYENHYLKAYINGR